MERNNRSSGTHKVVRFEPEPEPVGWLRKVNNGQLPPELQEIEEVMGPNFEVDNRELERIRERKLFG